MPISNSQEKEDKKIPEIINKKYSSLNKANPFNNIKSINL